MKTLMMTLYSIELYDPENGIWRVQLGLPKYIYPEYPTLLPWSGSVIALFSGDDQVYQRADDGTWSPLEGVVGIEYSDRMTIVPQDFADGCM